MIILDTQVVVWLQASSRSISKHAASAIRRASRAGEMAISAFTLYELASMMERGKIVLRGTMDDTLRMLIEGMVVKPITPEIAVLATQFGASLSHDPGDRIIAATARIDDLPLVTADEKIQACPLIRTIW